ncbi:MAG: phage portal protein [Planctomycetota bacterium]
MSSIGLDTAWEHARDRINADAERVLTSVSRRGWLGRAVDAFAGRFAPQWMAGRMLERQQVAMAAYHAGEINRLTADWTPEAVSGDQAVLEDGGVLNTRARNAARNSWAIKGINDSYRRDVGCPQPLACAYDPDKPRRDGKLRQFNQEVDWWWRTYWSDPSLCDLRGVQAGNDLIGLMVNDWVNVGNGLLIRSYVPRRDAPGLVLQSVEVEQLATDLYQHAGSGRRIKGGVEVDAYARPVAFHYYDKAHPYEDWRGDPVRIDASRVCHLTKPDRVRQALGPSQLSAVLLDDRELQGYLQAEARSKRLEACIAWQMLRDGDASGRAMKNDQIGMGGATAGADDKLTDAMGRPVRAIEPGMVLNNPKGVKLELMNPNRPGGTFDMYTRRREFQIAAGANRSRSSVTREYTSSYTAERRGLIEDRKVARMVQFDLLIPQVLLAIRQDFITSLLVQPGLLSSKAMAEALPLLGDMRRRRHLFETQWMPPEEEPIDEAKTAAARKINSGEFFEDRGSMLARQGRDWRSTFDDIAEQRDAADELGLPLPEFSGASSASPSAPRPRGQSNAPDGTSDNTDNRGRGSDGDDEAFGSWPDEPERFRSRRQDSLAEAVVREAVTRAD